MILPITGFLLILVAHIERNLQVPDTQELLRSRLWLSPAVLLSSCCLLMVSDHLTSDVKKAFSSAQLPLAGNRFFPCAPNPRKGGVWKSRSIRSLSNTQTYRPSGTNNPGRFKVTRVPFLYPILMLALMQVCCSASACLNAPSCCLTVAWLIGYLP